MQYIIILFRKGGGILSMDSDEDSDSHRQLNNINTYLEHSYIL